MIVFVVILGAVIIALLGYLGFAVDDAYLQGHTKGYDEGYRHGKRDALLDAEDDGK